LGALYDLWLKYVIMWRGVFYYMVFI